MDFQELFEILRGRLWLIVGVIAVSVGTATGLTMMMSNQYTATTSLIIDSRSADPFNSAAMPAQLASTYLATQRDILLSPRVAKRVIERLGLTNDEAWRQGFVSTTGGAGSMEDWLVSVLLPGLEVMPSRDSRVVLVNYTSTDPDFAKQAANAFAQAYIETNLELSIDPARQSTAWLDRQLKVLRSKAEEAQAKLTTFQQEHGIVATDERLDTELARLSGLSKSLGDAQAEAADISSRAQQTTVLLRAGEVDAETIPEVLANSFIQGLRTEILKQQAKLGELSSQLGRNHPQYLSAQAELDSLRGKMAGEIRSVASGLANQARVAQERVDSLQKAVDTQKSEILGLRQQRDEMSVLAKESENAQRNYDAALQRYNDVTLQSEISQTNVVTLTEAARPTQPSSPKLKLNVALAGFAGTVVALAVALLAELLDRRVRSRRALLSCVRAPLLGAVGRSA